MKKGDRNGINTLGFTGSQKTHWLGFADSLHVQAAFPVVLASHRVSSDHV